MKDPTKKEIKIRQSRFPLSLFWIFFGICAFMSGAHQGLLILMQRLQWSDIVSIHVLLFYWMTVAAGITLYVRWKMKKTYEIPLQMISSATKKIAQGDFSVYIAPIHTMDKWDYQDVMIMDINKMVEELGSIETLKTDFVSNVSHEMKTPIAVIKNSAQMIQLQTLSEEQKMEYARSIDHAAGKLSNLVTNILKLNRLEHQKIVPEKRDYDICRQLCDCMIQFEDKWEEKEINLEIHIEDAALVQADEQLMELVWNNLLSNALKFTEPGGTVTVRQTSDQDQVQVSVSDTGCGMSKKNISHIFDKFYQGDNSHSTEGNGLGLALVYRVLQLLDGDIQVLSKEGKGSTFTVTLPAVKNLTGGK